MGMWERCWDIIALEMQARELRIRCISLAICSVPERTVMDLLLVHESHVFSFFARSSVSCTRNNPAHWREWF